MAMLAGGIILAAGIGLAAATQTRAAGATTPTWGAECTVLGCGRMVL